MSQSITRASLDRLLESADIDAVSVPRLFELFLEDETLARAAPDGACRIDPRDQTVVIYNSKRAKRPHDNRPSTQSPANGGPKPCPICSGDTTGVVDLAPLSTGYTFINKNRFPCVYPVVRAETAAAAGPIVPTEPVRARRSQGLHFLQWSSSLHENDWHTMPSADLDIVLQRLACLERKLLLESEGCMPATGEWHRGRDTHGFVSIIKNFGAPVGGSLTHGHQQIAFSNTLPTHTFNNWRFLQDQGQPFAQHLLDHTPEELIVSDLGEVVWLVPYCMKRPYYSTLVLKDVQKQFLFEMTPSETTAMARGISRATRALAATMNGLGRELVYNALVHNGPGAGLHIELLPFIQETGGYEQLGLWVCQQDPSQAASTLRRLTHRL